LNNHLAVDADERASLIIFRIGSIGDTVVALPCFHAIARAFPHHRRILLTNVVASARASSVEALLAGTGLIDGTIYFPVGTGKLRYSVALARILRKLRARTLVYLTPRPTRLPLYRDLVFFRALGIYRIIGAPTAAEKRACRVDRATGELEYEAERLARVLAPTIPVNLSPANWDLHLSGAEHASARARLASLPHGLPLVALSPGAKVSEKDWGEENWSTLVQLLSLRLPPVSLVLVGAPDERSLAERLARHWAGPCANVCGQLTPRESAAVLERCDILVCHDSGPMHLAASRETPCVALFGNYNEPHRWFPYGSQHRVLYRPEGVRSIPVENVAVAVENTLVASKNSRPTNRHDGDACESGQRVARSC
jgi:ADP-heptose:LPS heptosyltransferase